MKTQCVLSTPRTTFNWGKKSDVVKLAGKCSKGWVTFNGRSDAIIAIIEAMTDAQICSQFALFFEEGHEKPSATQKDMLYEMLRVARHGSEATDKFIVWSKKFNVMTSLYEGVIKTVEETFHKSGMNTFAKWVGWVIEQSKDVNYLKKSKDIQKWVLNNHFQMLKKIDLDFVLQSGNALLDETKTTNIQDAVRKVVDIFQMIIEANATVAVYANDKMTWVVRNDAYDAGVGDVEMTVENSDNAVKSVKRIVTPSRGEQPVKKMKVGDEPKLGRSLFSNNSIGDETGKLLNSSDTGDGASVHNKSMGTLEVDRSGEETVQESLEVKDVTDCTKNDTSVENDTIVRIENTSNAQTAIEPGEQIERKLPVVANDDPSLSNYARFLKLKEEFEGSGE